MKKLLLSTCVFLSALEASSQCITNGLALPDVTLQCSGGTVNRTGVAYNPLQQLYYSVDAGNTGYPVETFTVTGGSALASNSQGADFRGLWWNPITNSAEGNTYNGGGNYSLTVNSSSYATGASYVTPAGMPSTQSMGHADVANNIVLYYNSGTLYKYTRSTGTLITSYSILGLPVSTSNLNSYGVFYSGVPGAEAGVYDYVNKAVYFINYNSGAYSGSVALPSSAPAASAYQMGFANNRIFLYSGSSSQWIGYPIVSPSSVSVSATPAFICSGSSATLNAGGVVSYTWNGTSGSNSMVVNPTSNATYTISGTNPSGCISSTVITLTVSPGPPSLTISPSSPTACLGMSVTLTATGAVTYTWNNNVTNGTAFAPSVTTVYSVSGTNGCGTTGASITITVAPLPLAITPGSTLFCSGKANTLNGISSGTTYTWLPIGVIGGSNVVVSPTATTVYTVAVSNGTCYGGTTFTANVFPSPVLNVGASAQTVCPNTSVTLTVGGASSYTWTTGGSTNTQVVVTPSASTLYSVAGTNQYGCTSGGSTVVLTAAAPVMNVSSSDGLVCSGSSVTLTDNGNSTSYTWSPGGQNTSSIVDNPTVTTTYTVVGSNNINCLSSATVQVIAFAPSFTLTSNSPICKGSTATVTAAGADSYAWSNFAIGNQTTFNPTVTTVYSVAATSSTNNLSCTVNKNFTITVNPLPTLTVSATHTALCKGETVTLTANGADTYTWTAGAVTGSTTSYTGAVPGTFNQMVTGTDVNRCSNTGTVTLKVNGCTGITENTNSSLVIYPNPSTGDIHLRSEKDIPVLIYSISGQHIRDMELTGGSESTISLPAGVYLLISKDRTVMTKLVITQ